MDHTIADMFYLHLPTGGPTQADIWSNLPSSDAHGTRCTGIVITPRCDFAHSKSPVLNYLPVIDLEKYILTVGCFPLLQSTISDVCDALKQKIRLADADHLLDLNIPYSEILEHIKESQISSVAIPTRQRVGAIHDIEAGLKKISNLEQLLKKFELTWDEAQAELNQKLLTKLQRDLIKNNSTDTYFLPPFEGLLPRPSVILLRHIYTCPLQLADNFRRHADLLRSEAPERLLRLKSPFIESLMAKFAALFTRVGTRDLPSSAVENYMLANARGAK